MKRAARILRFVAVQLLVLLLLLEIGLRVARPFSGNVRILLYLPTIATGFDDVRTVPDLLGRTILGFGPYREYAGFLRNSRGFRTHEYTTEKAPGSTRLVVLGDSFTAECGGIPYPQMWHTLLGDALGAARPDSVEVISLGVPGVGVMFERRMWELEGARLHPDAVLLQLFVGNDFTDEYDLDLRPGVAASAARWSYAVRFLRNAGRALAARRSGAALATAAADGAAVRDASGRPVGGVEILSYRETSLHRKPYMSPRRLLEVESQRMRLCEKAQGEQFRELLGRMTTILGSLHDEMQAAGVPLFVVIIPDRFQVNPAERSEMLAFLGMTEDEFTDWDLPQRELGSFLRGEGIEFLDLLPAIRAGAAEEPLYVPDDIHWNVRGNAVAARALAEWLAPKLPPPGGSGR